MQTGVDCDVEKPCKMVWTDYVWTTKSWSYMSHKYPTHPTLCTSHTSPLVSKRHTTSHKSGIPQIRQASHSDCGKASVHIPSPTGHPTLFGTSHKRCVGPLCGSLWDVNAVAGVGTPLTGHLWGCPGVGHSDQALQNLHAGQLLQICTASEVQTGCFSLLCLSWSSSGGLLTSRSQLCKRRGCSFLHDCLHELRQPRLEAES